MRRGDYCASGDAVIFDLVTAGDLPLSALGEVHRGVCLNDTHTPHCLARYHRRMYKLSASSIRRFLESRNASAVDLVQLAKALKKSHREAGFWLRALYNVVHRVPTLRMWARRLVDGPRIRVATYYFAALTGVVGAPAGNLLWKRQEDFRLYPDVQWYLYHLVREMQLKPCFASESLKSLTFSKFLLRFCSYLPFNLIIEPSYPISNHLSCNTLIIAGVATRFVSV